LDGEHGELSLLIPWDKSLRSQITHIRDDELVRAILDTPDLDIARIWDLFTESSEELLTDHLRDTQIHRLVGILILLVEIRSLWELGSYSIDKFSKSCPIDRVDLVVDIFPEISLFEILLGFYSQNRLGHM
jgi:hypothetical protein